MKKKFPILISLTVLILVGCKSANVSALNTRISTAQKLSVEKSPFDTAKSTGAELKTQIGFRDEYVNKLTQLREIFPSQPLILTESYMFICDGCKADYVSIFTDGILYEYTFSRTQNKYIEKSKKMSVEDLIYEGGAHDDIKEIYDALITNKKWNEDPRKYGDENCFDGSQTFYTVFNLENKVESMYMRCWIPADFRKQ
ncbi:hypothetical protein [Salegentibacter mishustinae]|uniref:hypothetical protein n=1 Tax=Salegentibacter mishustinae TaxID=270918 RepID=UPI002492B933|nr:hypothetical protein [Salegentibacter mishustinae]